MWSRRTSGSPATRRATPEWHDIGPPPALVTSTSASGTSVYGTWGHSWSWRSPLPSRRLIEYNEFEDEMSWSRPGLVIDGEPRASGGTDGTERTRLLSRSQS